jgi:hypothetical protein
MAAAAPADPDFPIPFGIDADTGKALPGLTFHDLTRIDSDSEDVRNRSETTTADHFAIADVDPNNLEEAGWCVVFANDADPAIKKALEPLLKLRESQSKRLYKEFEGVAGVRSQESARAWVERQGAGFFVVDPDQGLPLYVLLVGSPERISFEFQYLLDLNWNVGRLHFDTADEYKTYAESVVAYEMGATVPHGKHAAIFCVKNDGDRPTALLHDNVAAPLVTGSPKVRTLSGYRGFQTTALLAENATKQRLISLLSGRESGGAPAFLFSGSHGVRFRVENPEQREKQGAILCQDWPGFGATQPEHLFTAADVPSDAPIHGLIHFFFACYGGGCPRIDNYGLVTGREPAVLGKEAIVARLPQRLLTRGALASLAHIDRAWAYSFQNSRSQPQVQEMRDVMVRILQGQRIGQATESLNVHWAVLSAELQHAMSEHKDYGSQVVSDTQLANRYVARNDARNYVVIGDPAVRLRVESMTA